MPPREDDHPTADELRVLHWNIHSWVDPETQSSNLDVVAELIRTTNPDAVSLVEVNQTWESPSPLAELAERAGYSWIFAPAFEYGDTTPTGGFGNAILSRLPIRAVTQRQLTWPTTLYDHTEPSEPRTVVLATISRSPTASVQLGSTHLPSADADARNRALNRLREIAAGLEGAWMICGDFNTAPSAWLSADNGFVISPSVEEPTYPTKGPSVAIDYCIASPTGRIRAEVLPGGGSDHLPVLFHWKLTQEEVLDEYG
jgi:endonuclease/exonuclease/phosphatase family metal-dependent hydrolase